MLDLVLDGLKDLMKQMRAHEMRFKQPQNGTKLSPKSTPRSKRNKTREKHMKGKHLYKKNNLVSLGNKASRRKINEPKFNIISCHNMAFS
jgi:hypothetical protein